MNPWPAVAAANNAQLCDLVCRTHGIGAEHDSAAWTSPKRTPALYPDAVTLVPDLALPDLLARIDTSAGCSIKDSFASLDLDAYGFRMLFDAQWMVRTPTPAHAVPADPDWTVVQDVGAFAAWETAWRGKHGPPDVLRADLLRDDSLTVLAAHADDRIVGGAILNRSAKVVGISNFFAEDRIAPVSWHGCLALASALFPGETFVGYESGDTLAAAEAHGFDAVGPLRVWVNEA